MTAGRMTLAPARRIIHVVAQLRFGAGRYVVDTVLSQERLSPGRVAVVISNDGPNPWVSSQTLLGELSQHNVPVWRCGDFFSRQAATLKDAANNLSSCVEAEGGWSKDSVVHAHTAMAATVAKWAGAPRVVLTCHGWGMGRPDAFDLQDALAYSLCDEVISPSESWAAAVREKTARDNVRVLPYGFDLRRLERDIVDDHRRPLRVVSVAELSNRKGVDVLLSAMPSVWARHPEVELHLVGDGPLASQLKAQAEALDPSGSRILFHGMVDDPLSLVSRCDVFALASRSDNQPVAIIEAMATGLPILATRVGGIAELVEGSRCGFVVPPENPYELAVALSVLLDTHARGRRELGSAGAQFVAARFGVDAHVHVLERIYAGLQIAPPTSADVPSGQLVRLHVGCGTERRQGWVNIDCAPEVKPDILARAHELGMFPDATVDVVEACHLLEHLPVHEARAAIAEWARVLRPGGELLLEMPDFNRCVGLLGKAHDSHGYDLAMVGIYGWPVDVEREGPAMGHKWGWSPDTLSAELGRHGFDHVERQPVTQTWRPATAFERDFRLLATKTRVQERRTA